VSDRVILNVVGLDDLAPGFALLASEVLATEVLATKGEGEGTRLDLDDERDALAWIKKV
jgi:hypothetical protein